jgi:hypothetical protein
LLEKQNNKGDKMKGLFSKNIIIGLLLLALNLLNLPAPVVKGQVFPPVRNLSNSLTYFPLQTTAPKKRAVIVGISDYETTIVAAGRGKPTNVTRQAPLWPNLHTIYEVDSLAQVLRDPDGRFKFDEVVVLKDKEATRENILKNFQTVLIDKTQPGDIAYFHYSGHGGQAPDDSKHGPNPKVGDEIDNLDETLIPFDYKSKQDPSNDIRDDEIEGLLQKLQDKKPANITMTFDSCHSGTIQRGGESLIRGGAWKGEVPKTRGPENKPDSPGGLLAEDQKLEPGVVIISAARHNQLAKETVDQVTKKEIGVFTYSYLRALREAGPDTTYRDIFQRVNDEVSRLNHDQNPQIEGSIDQKLMSGTVRKPQPYIPVEVTYTKTIKLKSGNLFGVTKGSEYSIYENGKDASNGKPIAQAVVKNVLELTSDLEISPNPDAKLLEKLRTGRAILTKYNYGDLRLKVVGKEFLLPAGEPNDIGSDLIVAETTSQVKEIKNYDVRICLGKCNNELPDSPPVLDGDFLTLQRISGGEVIQRVSRGETAKVLNILEGEARWRFFNNLKDGGNPELSGKVQIRLVPVKVTETNTRGLASKVEDLAPQASVSRGGRLELREGELYMLEVLNLSGRDLFVTVLDIDSTGKVNPLFPHPKIPLGNSSENLFAKAKNDASGNPVWQRVPLPFVIGITPPFGQEVIRIIATTEPNDFSAIFNSETRGAIQRGGQSGNERGTREAQTPLGKLMMSAMTGQTTRGRRGDIFGAENLGNTPTEASSLIVSLPFEVKPKKD